LFFFLLKLQLDANRLQFNLIKQSNQLTSIAIILAVCYFVYSLSCLNLRVTIR